MKANYDYEIKYQEVDGNRRLRLHALENYLLEVAGRAADDLGFGILHFHPQGLTWVLTSLSVEMNYMPTYCEHITFETWIEANAHMLSIRDFRIYRHTAEGEKQQIGQAKSQWVVFDLAKREIVNAFDQPCFEGTVDGERLNISRMPRLTPIIEPTGCTTRTVLYSDIDYNGHCNSCKYLEHMLDTALPNYDGHPLRLDINYQHEIKFGEQYDTLYLVLPDGIQYQQKHVDGTTACSAKITLL